MADRKVLSIEFPTEEALVEFLEQRAQHVAVALNLDPQFFAPYRSAPPTATDKPNVASYVDHTVLKAEAVTNDVDVLCEEAKLYGFAAVCVNGCNVARAVANLKGSSVKVAAVVGFPLGAMTSKAKAAESRELVEEGVNELDMVINVARLLEGNLVAVYEDIKAVVDAAGDKAIVKVIIETDKLKSSAHVVDACLCSAAAGAHFVKTSTGFATHPGRFGTTGAAVFDVALMKRAVGAKLRVKASGGVSAYTKAVEVINVGADRIGTSSGIKLVKEAAGAAADAHAASNY
eukprot:Colp12_sorted_trinity150504_noHs@3604